MLESSPEFHFIGCAQKCDENSQYHVVSILHSSLFPYLFILFIYFYHFDNCHNYYNSTIRIGNNN